MDNFKDDKYYAEKIIDNINAIEKYVKDINYEHFLNDGDFIFDADDTYLAKTNGETNAFLGLDGDSLVQKIIAFTIVYTSSPHDDYKVNVSFRASHSWSDTERAQLDSPVSGKRYTFDDPEFVFYFCNSSATFRFFAVQDYLAQAAITSITLEYACE